MRKKLPLLTVLLIALAAVLTAPSGSLAAAKISAAEYKAGDMVTIEGAIEPGQDLYIAVAQQKMFAVKDTDGVNERKRLEKDMKKNKFNADTAIPPLYYLLTTPVGASGQGPWDLLHHHVLSEKEIRRCCLGSKSHAGSRSDRRTVEFSEVCQ